VWVDGSAAGPWGDAAVGAVSLASSKGGAASSCDALYGLRRCLLHSQQRRSGVDYGTSCKPWLDCLIC
jgi:hypothetical protein